LFRICVIFGFAPFFAVRADPMPRKRLIRRSDRPYHVYNRANNRDPFLLPMDLMWKLVLEKLRETQKITNCVIHAVVLMPNHYHLVVSCPGSDLGIVMREFSRRLASAYNRFTGREGHLFTGTYKNNLIHTLADARVVAKYVYRNPVKAKICDRVEDFRYTSVHALMSRDAEIFRKIDLDPTFESLNWAVLKQDAQSEIEWLNIPFKNELDQSIRKAIRRREFRLSSLGTSRRKVSAA
jgi:putative transposase